MTYATGGSVTETIINNKKYRIHTFTGDGTLTFSEGGNVEYLIVGGGGSGGRTNSESYSSGGGGGGGLLRVSSVVASGAFSVTVGVGGAAPTTTLQSVGNNGGNSSFAGFTALGGGGGAAVTVDAQNGGSGGGGSSGLSNNSGVLGLGQSGQGFNGGNFQYDAGSSDGVAGGGGGAGSVGQNGVFVSLTNRKGGNGGDGLLVNFDGTARYYGGGGGGTCFLGISYNGSLGTGGLGGGGRAGHSSGTLQTAEAGTDGLGGGSGGAGGSVSGMKGGNGIVMIRYEFSPGVALTALDLTAGVPAMPRVTFRQDHNLIGSLLLAQSPLVATTTITQTHVLTASGISVIPVMPPAQLTPDPMPTEIRVTLYDANGNFYPNGTPVFIYKADGSLEYTTSVGQIVGHKPGVYPMPGQGELAVRFPPGDFQQRFIVVGPAVDEAGLVTNMLTAIQLIAGQG